MSGSKVPPLVFTTTTQEFVCFVIAGSSKKLIFYQAL